MGYFRVVRKESSDSQESDTMMLTENIFRLLSSYHINFYSNKT